MTSEHHRCITISILYLTIKTNGCDRSMKSDLSPKWHEDIIAMAGYWEPVSFQIRNGRAYRGIREDDFPYSKAMAEKMERLGINLVVWHYYKGLGIQTEEEEMQNTAGFFKHLPNSIGKGAYINIGSFFADTFLSENPQANNWLTRDQNGLPQQYSEYYRIYYRFRPCMSNPEFGEYVGNATAKAIADGANMICMDNSAQMPCYCDNCRKKFPEYVLERYPSSAAEGELCFKERFGYEYTGRLEIPRGTSRMPIDNLPGAHEPGLYEWIKYRQQSYENTHQRVTQMAREASSEVRISWNIAMDYGEFTGLVWGIDAETSIRSKSDFFFSEDENNPGIENGNLIRHISTYKYGRAMNNRVLVHNVLEDADDAHRLLAYAEAASFNQGCVGRVMWATDDERKFDITKRSLDFFRKNRQAYLNTQPLSRIALYRCSESETITWADSTLARHAVEQVLIKDSVQYDHILNATLSDLAKYELLICPATSCVSDQSFQLITDYIRSGGKILAVGDCFNRDGIGRRKFFQSDVGLNGERDSNLGRNSSNEKLAGILETLGLDDSYTDRVFYLPKLAYSVTFEWRPDNSFLPVIGKEYFVEPVNADELRAILACALSEKDFEMTAPENVVAGLFRTAEGDYVVHILDYEAGRKLSGLRVRLTGLCQPTAAKFNTIDCSVDIVSEMSGEYVEFTLPDFDTYGFVLIPSE